MKKIAYISTIGIAFLFAACSGSPKTGDSQADSGSHGSSGVSDTSAKMSTMGSSAQSTAGSDTSKNNKGTNAPVADTANKEKP